MLDICWIYHICLLRLNLKTMSKYKSKLHYIVFTSRYPWIPVDTCRYLWTCRWSVVLQVPDPLAQVIRGNLSVRLWIRIFETEIPAGRIRINPRVNSWCSLVGMDFRRWPLAIYCRHVVTGCSQEATYLKLQVSCAEVVGKSDLGESQKFPQLKWFIFCLNCEHCSVGVIM